MSSNLKVNTILPSTGSNIGIGTNGGELNVDGGCKVQVGTALTLGHSIGLQYATQNLHSAGFEINQINASGIVTATTFSGSGASLTNLPAGQLTGALPAIDGSNLTGITGTTINNNANDRVITGSGTANTLNGESGLTFNGSTMNLTAASGDARLSLFGTEGNDARISLIADEGDDHIDQWNIRSKASNNNLTIDQFGGGTFNTRLTIASDANNGNVTVNTGNLIIGTSGKGIDFSATSDYSAISGSQSELLDDYEEGSYNPTLTGSGGGSFAMNPYSLRYTKIGRVVHVSGRFYIYSSSGLSGAEVRMTLPYINSSDISSQDARSYSYVSTYNAYSPNSDYQLVFSVLPNSGYGVFLWIVPNAAWQSVSPTSHMNQNAAYYGFNFTYTTAS